MTTLESVHKPRVRPRLLYDDAHAYDDDGAHPCLTAPLPQPHLFCDEALRAEWVAPIELGYVRIAEQV